MEILRSAYYTIEDDIAKYKPKTAKVLQFLFSFAIITISSLIMGLICSLIVRSFTDHSPRHLGGMMFIFLLITVVLYAVLYAIRGWRLYSLNGILNNPKFVVLVQKHKDWLLNVSTCKFEMYATALVILVSWMFLSFDFDIKVQVGSWVSAIDSKAFTLAALTYFWYIWSAIYKAIKGWVTCIEILNRCFGV